MSSPSRRPISLNALATFESAARLLNFGAAAAELNLTRSAVSHQILKLEKSFGLRLFERRRDGVALTPSGDLLYEKVRKSLTEINQATDELLTVPRRRRLTVQSAPTLASRWLVGRLDGFLSHHPQLDFQLIAASDSPDFRDPSLDLAICYGHDEWPGCDATLLMAEKVQPLCNPQLVECARIRAISDLARATLIRTDLNVISWDTWLADRGVKLSPRPRQIRLNPSYLALDAAMRGLGVVLESDILAHAEMASGHLIAPFDQSHATLNAYYVVRPRDDRRRNSTSFLAWLLQEASGFRT